MTPLPPPGDPRQPSPLPPPGYLPPPGVYPGPYAGPMMPPGFFPPAPVYVAPPPPPGSGRGSIISAVIAWIVILGVTAMIASRGAWLPDRWRAIAEGKGRGDDAAATQPSARALPTVESVRTPQVQFIARYAMGMKGLVGATAETQKLLKQLADQVEAAGASAGSPIGEFRTIPVTAELLGKEAALKRLDAFEKNHKVVRLRQDVDDLRALYTAGKLDDAARDRLEARHGFAGRLAGTFGLPDTDARRQAALAMARQATTLSIVAFALVVLAGIAGFILLCIVAFKLIKGTWTNRYVRPGPADSAPIFAESFAIYLGLFYASSVLLAIFWPDLGLAGSYGLALIVPAAVLWMRTRGVSSPEIRYGLGWHRGRGFFREALAGVVGYIAGLPLLALGIFATDFLTKWLNQGIRPTHPAGDMPLDTAGDILQLFLVACVIAPITEELMFRGALFHHTRRFGPWIVSAIVTGFLFAVIHPQGIFGVPVLMSIAIVLAGIRQWRGSVVGSVVAHALNNGAVLASLVLFAR